ncbi:MAG: aminopeptidase N [Proteobacteria bacterium]|nr:aminopeptidase N [Pseudomonadota bacterium]MBU1715604.1 aminopeptidase N [Pseudomonadota bacterium]
MTESKPRPVYLKEYVPPQYLVGKVELEFDFGDQGTKVKSRLTFSFNFHSSAGPSSLILNGRKLQLLSIKLDDKKLTEEEYLVQAETLTVFSPPADSFVLETEVLIFPDKNTALEGLYRSSGNFCTQCEAQGFRQITYFPDRPDVMSRYTVTLVADKGKYPVLLSNGNLEGSGDLPAGRHWARYVDPFPKPSYLFALVAGDLVKIEDGFVTRSGREVSLQIYVEAHNRDKCGHAMASLKKAMHWDEEIFGLEYDLDQYMIVAVDDFNMGAMENKGLNIFNSKYVLALPDTATDDDYEGIEAVIAHEYFHNWTGNRVTCRDWFQLSLKEGLTVFRDQEFSADMMSRAVKRITDVNMLRNRQFPEDAGPMAHPVRPESYIEINNFYTVTVYEKGAELIRMLQTLLGAEKFRQGVSLYLRRHDGQAATCDEFVAAMAEVGQIDLGQFKLWYSQAGTPELTVKSDYDADGEIYTITVEQHCPDTPGQHDKAPLHIPFAVGLLAPDGRSFPLQLVEEQGPAKDLTRLLELKKKEEVFRFVNIKKRPVPSLLRDFSAPVNLNYNYTDEDLGFILAHDPDMFNRWEAGQRLALRIILHLVNDFQNKKEFARDHGLAAIFRSILEDENLVDHSLVAQLLILPSEGFVAEQMAIVDVEAIHAARDYLRQSLAGKLREVFMAAYRNNADLGPYRYDAGLAGRRNLKNLSLSYLMTRHQDDSEVRDLCRQQFEQADNMSDEISAFKIMVHTGTPGQESVLINFQKKWGNDVLVMDKWLTVQATAPCPATLARVKELEKQPVFSINNPNRVRSLIGAFAGANPICFHAKDGSGYRFVADRVLDLDRINSQISARLAQSLSRWHRYDQSRQALMRAELERIMVAENISKDVYEIVTKSLSVS